MPDLEKGSGTPHAAPESGSGAGVLRLRHSEKVIRVLSIHGLDRARGARSRRTYGSARALSPHAWSRCRNGPYHLPMTSSGLTGKTLTWPSNTLSPSDGERNGIGRA